MGSSVFQSQTCSTLGPHFVSPRLGSSGISTSSQKHGVSASCFLKRVQSPDFRMNSWAVSISLMWGTLELGIWWVLDEDGGERSLRRGRAGFVALCRGVKAPCKVFWVSV